MSARSLFVLALVALVTIQANSYPTKGAQSYYEEPLKGGFQAPHQAPAQVELPAVAAPAPVLSQSYEAPVKGASQSFYSEPIKGYAPQPLRQSTVAASEYRPVQQFAQTTRVEAPAPVQMPAYEAPVKGVQSYGQSYSQSYSPSYSQSYGQSYHQEPVRTQYYQQPMPVRQPMMESYKAPAPLVQAAPQQVELAVTPAPVQLAQTYEAPIKGASQSFYSEPFKGSFQQPARLPAVESFARPVQQVQSTHVVESAPVQSYEAPVKGSYSQSYYQEPLKGQFSAPQQLRH